METELQQIADRLVKSFAQPGEASSLKGFLSPLLQLLTNGKPVTVEELASSTGKSVEEVGEVLPTLSSMEFDELGSIVGYGLTLNPTPHHFRVNGKQLYTWCALDTLMFPEIIARTVEIESPCYSTGIPVRLKVEPGRVVSVEPSTSVVSMVTPDNMSSVRSAFCNEVHFFSSVSAAQNWLDQHPGASILRVKDAFELGRTLGERFEDAGNAESCCEL